MMCNSSYLTQGSSDKYHTLLAQVESFRLEKASIYSRQHQIEPSSWDLDQLIVNLTEQKNKMDPYCYTLRLNALKRIRTYGFDPENIIEKVVLPEGYTGKILMISISGGVLDKKVCLRSGDLWHREILRNTQLEIHHLGFTISTVHELGGAYVKFEKTGEIQIYGTSDDFGPCDKLYASELIQQTFQDRNIRVLE
jgi:hypothetical protein